MEEQEEQHERKIIDTIEQLNREGLLNFWKDENDNPATCLLYTSPSPRDRTRSRMPSSA